MSVGYFTIGYFTVTNVCWLLYRNEPLAKNRSFLYSSFFAPAESLPYSGSFTPEFISDEDEPKPKKRDKSKKKKRLQADDTSGIQTKKPPMKTATDVIHRIMWDECLNKDDFTVGYLDRFVGILEERFSIFDWGDIAEADFLALAVPRHRIQYFKYKDITVWDKTQRLDLVFGSTGSSTTIRDIIKRFEKEDGHVEEKEACEPESNGEEMMMVDEGEAEGSTEVITNLNETEDAEEAKHGRAKTSNRVTHFLAVRITAPEVIENVQKFQEKVCEADQALKRACIVPEKLHITLGVMRLETSEEEELAAKVLKDLEGELALCFSPSTRLNFKRIECWQSRVVVSPVEGQEEKESLGKGMRMILSKLQEVGIEVKDERREFTPHLTAMKVQFAMRKKKNKKKISEEVVRPHQDFQLGCQDVDEIHLCSMIGKPREDGFYQTLATVSASLESI